MTEQQYIELRTRLENDPIHVAAIVSRMQDKFLASIGRILLSFILWLLEMLLKASGFLVWPLLGYLRAKGYINIDLEEVKKWISG